MVRIFFLYGNVFSSNWVKLQSNTLKLNITIQTRIKVLTGIAVVTGKLSKIAVTTTADKLFKSKLFRLIGVGRSSKQMKEINKAILTRL